MSMHPIVERFLQGGLPEPMAMALVGGSLPVPTMDLLQALAHACLKDTKYTQRGLDFFATMPESLLAGVLADRLDPPAPLQLVLCHRKEPALLETTLLNPSLTAAILEASVPSLPMCARTGRPGPSDQLSRNSAEASPTRVGSHRTSMSRPQMVTIHQNASEMMPTSALSPDPAR